MTASPVRRVLGPTKICYDCDHELYPKGKIIIGDPLAKRDRNGKWHCSECQLTDKRRNLLKIYGPNHVNTRSFVEYEDKKIGVWNQAVKKYGIRQPYRKNKYTGKTSF